MIGLGDRLWNHLAKVRTGRIRRAYSRSTGAIAEVQPELKWQLHQGRTWNCQGCGSSLTTIPVPSSRGGVILGVAFVCIIWGIKDIFGL